MVINNQKDTARIDISQILDITLIFIVIILLHLMPQDFYPYLIFFIIGLIFGGFFGFVKAVKIIIEDIEKGELKWE